MFGPQMEKARKSMLPKLGLCSSNIKKLYSHNLLQAFYAANEKPCKLLKITMQFNERKSQFHTYQTVGHSWVSQARTVLDAAADVAMPLCPHHSNGNKR